MAYADGDDAAAAGMDVMTGFEDRRDGFKEVNKTRDYIARRTSTVQPVAKGGTGAADAAGARTNLSVPSVADMNTGLGGKSPIGHTHAFPAITPGAIDNGGFGATFGPTRVAAALTVDTTANVGGRITNPYARANGVGSWISLGVDPAGNVGISTSSVRFKKEIKTWSPDAQAVYAMRLVQFRYKVAVILDSPVEHGVIAEELLALGLDWLVFFDDDGQPLGVHYDKIALACVAAVQDLNERVTRLEARS